MPAQRKSKSTGVAQGQAKREALRRLAYFGFSLEILEEIEIYHEAYGQPCVNIPPLLIALS